MQHLPEGKNGLLKGRRLRTSLVIIEENPTREELEIWYHASGLPETFFHSGYENTKD